MPVVRESPPYTDPIVIARDPRQQTRVPDLILGTEWQRWFANLSQDVEQAPNRKSVIVLTDQEASLGTTSIPAVLEAPGLWRVSYYARVTRAASVSSSLIVTIGWTDGAVALTKVGATLNGNTTSTLEQATILVRADAASVLSYATTYASAGGTSMRYRLSVLAELLAYEAA